VDDGRGVLLWWCGGTTASCTAIRQQQKIRVDDTYPGFTSHSIVAMASPSVTSIRSVWVSVAFLDAVLRVLSDATVSNPGSTSRGPTSAFFFHSVYSGCHFAVSCCVRSSSSRARSRQ
jgi:hypothetical protein